MGRKTGKEIKITCLNENIKCLCGAIENYKSPKSVYIYITTWISPIKEKKYNRVISSFERKIKKLIEENNLINTEVFNSFYILDLDIRTSGIRMNKKSFMSLEFNLYQKGPEDNYLPLHSNKNKKDLIPYITKFVNNIILSDLFVNNEFFDFYLRKKLNHYENTI